MSLHPLDVFPETIWTRIFENVKRPWPSIRLGGHDCCFQPDLARLMAVHPALHELVGPVLYRECVVVDLEMFFVGLDGQTQRPEDSERFWNEAGQNRICENVSTIPGLPNPAPSLYHVGDHNPSAGNAKRSSKRDLLSHVKVLHLATASLKKSPTINFGRPCGNPMDYVFHCLVTRRGLEMFQRASSGSSASSNNPLGSLHKITLDLYLEPDQFDAEGADDWLPHTGILLHAQNDLYEAFDRFLTVVQPKWVCQHRATNRFCEWMPGMPPCLARQVMGDRAPAIFVSHDFKTTCRIPTGYEYRQYIPTYLQDPAEHPWWFLHLESGFRFCGQLQSETSTKGWLTTEFMLEARNTPSRRSEKVYELIKHKVAPKLHDKIRVIVGGNEAQSPWGSCGCPAAVET